MSRPVTSLARDEVRLEDGTITTITAGDTWVEFDPDSTLQTRSNIVEQYVVVDIVTDAVQVETTTESGESMVGDYDMQEFRDDAMAGVLVPKAHAFPDDEPPTAAELTELLAATANTSVDAEVLIEEFDSKHNALQDRVFTAILKPLVLSMATTTQIDRRNKNTVDASRNIAELMDWELPDQRQ